MICCNRNISFISYISVQESSIEINLLKSAEKISLLPNLGYIIFNLLNAQVFIFMICCNRNILFISDISVQTSSIEINFLKSAEKNSLLPNVGCIFLKYAQCTSFYLFYALLCILFLKSRHFYLNLTAKYGSETFSILK